MFARSYKRGINHTLTEVTATDSVSRIQTLTPAMVWKSLLYL